MVILGIDPGLATIGFGVVNTDKGNFSVIDYGVILTPKEECQPKRLELISDGINALLDRFKPHDIAIEQLFFARNVKTALSVAEARGAILLTLVKRNSKLYEYTPNEVKIAISGYGSADKYQMQNMVRILLKIKDIPRPDDAADALAVALCHAQTDRFKQLHKV